MTVRGQHQSSQKNPPHEKETPVYPCKVILSFSVTNIFKENLLPKPTITNEESPGMNFLYSTN